MTIEELKVVITAETNDIKKKTQEIRNSLKGLKTQSEKVTQSSKSLEKAHKAAERATKSHDKEAKRLGQELLKSLKQFDRQKEAINRCKLAADRSGAAYDKLKDKFAAQKSEIAAQNGKVAQLEKTYQKLSKAMDQHGTYDNMRSTEQGLTKQLSDLIQQRRSMEEAAEYMRKSGSKTTLTSEGVMNKSQLADAMKRNSLATEELQGKLYSVRDAIEQVQTAGLKNLDENSLGRLGRELDKARQKLRDLESGLRDTGNRMDIAGQKSAATSGKLAQMKRAASDTSGRIGQLSKALKGFSGIRGSLTGVKERLKGIGDSARKTASGMRSAKKDANALVRAFGLLGMTFKFMVASMAISAAMRGAGEGFKNLSQYSQKTNRDLSMLMSALTQLKNSFAAAFAPVLSVVAPILSKLIGWLSSAMNALAHFFAALTGQSKVVVAKKVNQDFAASVADTGSAADEANKKAEKYKKTLMGFDQINKLDEPDKESGGSGGGSGGDLSPGDMFETVEVGNKWAGWADKIKEAWAKADFTEIGEIVGNKLNAALEKIPWDKIKATSAKIAKSIATFLNGFIAAADWALVGGTLAEAVNTVIEFAYSFVTNFNWRKFGVAIGTAVNGFFAKLDLAKAGKTLSEGVKGVLDAAIRTMETIDWGQIGRKIANLICNIDWIGVAKRIISLLGNAIVGAVDALSGFIDQVGRYLVNYIKSGDIWKDLFGLAKLTLEVSVKLIKAGWNLISAFVGTLVNVSVALIKSGWNLLKDFVGDKVTAAVSLVRSGWSSLKHFVGEKVTAAVSLVKSGWSSLKNFVGSKVAAGVSLFKSGWSTLKNFVGGKVSVGISLIKSGWKSLKDWVFGGIKSLALKLGLPKIKVKWSSKTFAGFKISYPSGFETYAKGGFPEEGPFMMNRGEIAGKFKNGKSVVANNQQITDGIAAAVYRAFRGANEGNRGGVSEATFLNAVNLLIAAVRESGVVIGDEEIARSAERGRAKIDRRYNPVTG